MGRPNHACRRIIFRSQSPVSRLLSPVSLPPLPPFALLYSLLQPFAHDIRIFNLLNYITFRSAAAFVTALLVSFVLGPVIINRLRAMAVHQVVRAGTPDSHAGKGTTPTMGGLIILVASFCPCCSGHGSTTVTYYWQ